MRMIPLSHLSLDTLMRMVERLHDKLREDEIESMMLALLILKLLGERGPIGAGLIVDTGTGAIESGQLAIGEDECAMLAALADVAGFDTTLN